MFKADKLFRGKEDREEKKTERWSKGGGRKRWKMSYEDERGKGKKRKRILGNLGRREKHMGGEKGEGGGEGRKLRGGNDK